MAEEIETERLRLRGYALADLPRFHEIWSDPGVVGPMGANAHDRGAAADRMMRYVGHWVLRGFGTWAVEEKASGRLIGEVGLFDYERDLPQEFAGRPEHGWALAAEAQGQGYASEMAAASLAWGAQHFKPFRPFCIIAEANAPSLRLAARIGYEERVRTLWRGTPTVILTRA